jgi:plasmid stabilization system protein ParE
MSLPLVYRRNVGRDLADAFAYYEEQAERLGERFLGAVDSTFDAIERYPEVFAKVHSDVRRAVISQFPYAVFYRIEPKRVVVFRVLHTARDPRVWPQPRRMSGRGDR